MAAIICVKGDITEQVVDAVVNAANETLRGGLGVDGAIHKAAGPELLAECETLGGCEIGDAKITKGYNLPAKHVIHTVGPYYTTAKKDAYLLESCYKRSLEIARDHKLKTIAFPSISTGFYHYPIEEAAPIAVKTVQEWEKKHPGALDEIRFVLFNDKDFEIYNELLK